MEQYVIGLCMGSCYMGERRTYDDPIQTGLVYCERCVTPILLVTTLPSAHVQRALPVYISAILFQTLKICWIYIVDIVGYILHNI